MLQIGIVLSAVCSLVLGHTLALAFRSWARTAFCLMLGFAVAALVYFGALLAIVATYRLSQPMGAVVYGGGFLVATLAAVMAARLVAPARLSGIIISGACVLAVMFPFGLNGYFGMIGTWQPVHMLYMVGGLWGGCAVARLASRLRSGLPFYGV